MPHVYQPPDQRSTGKIRSGSALVDDPESSIPFGEITSVDLCRPFRTAPSTTAEDG
jgi:hypothetical protein